MCLEGETSVKVTFGGLKRQLLGCCGGCASKAGACAKPQPRSGRSIAAMATGSSVTACQGPPSGSRHERGGHTSPRLLQGRVPTPQACRCAPTSWAWCLCMKSEFMRSRSRGASGSNSCSQEEKGDGPQRSNKGPHEGLGSKHPRRAVRHALSGYRYRDV